MRYRRQLLLALLMSVAIVVILRCAWVSDDAYITFRVVDNLWHGHGLRWNVDERVWVYTDPLLMLCMAGLYPLTHEFFYTSIFFGAIVAVLALALVLYRLAPNAAAALLAGGLLLVSKAFVDYTTSGLENSLTYLLLALSYWLAFTKDVRADRILAALAAAAGFALLNRADTALLLAPLLVWAWSRRPSARRLLLVAAGISPFVLWEIFAVAYYGSLFPNSARVRLDVGIPRLYLLGKGLAYYLDSLLLDPITLPAIAVAVVVALRARSAPRAAAASGVILYLAYVAWIGGDFMSGRFFAAPMLASVMLLVLGGGARLGGARIAGLAIAGAAILAAGLLHPLSPWRSGADYGPGRMAIQDHEIAWGISDERGHYYPGAGLLRAGVFAHMPSNDMQRAGLEARDSGERVLVSGAIGFRGFFAGPAVHVVDVCALGDPLLARLPTRLDRPPRIGHFVRSVPAGYVETARAGRNQIEDPGLAELYEAIRRITAGPIWDRRRWLDIWNLNAGRYDHLVDVARYRGAGAHEVEALQRERLRRQLDRIEGKLGEFLHRQRAPGGR